MTLCFLAYETGTIVPTSQETSGTVAGIGEALEK